MNFSDFGKKLSGKSGIFEIQADLGKALAAKPSRAMFGSGNPAHIPEVQAIITRRLSELMSDQPTATKMVNDYDGPQGNAAFITAIKNFMNRHYSLGITEDNIAITPGSQAGYFMLFNLLSGSTGGAKTKILFPLVTPNLSIWGPWPSNTTFHF
jgi:valine--pyruvate aminotransferase